VGAEIAWAAFGNVLADITENDTLLYCHNGLGQELGLLGRHPDKVVGQPLGALWADARKFVELLNQASKGSRHGRQKIIGH
jgi:hypothetical protein